jgi:hypothetical protein
MIENLLDGGSFQDRGDDLEFTTAVWAVLKIEVEDTLQELRPSQAHRSPMLCLAILLRLHFWAGSAGTWGTTLAHCFAFGACTPCAKRGDAHFAQRSDATTKADQVQSRLWHQRRQALHKLQGDIT